MEGKEFLNNVFRSRGRPERNDDFFNTFDLHDSHPNDASPFNPCFNHNFYTDTFHRGQYVARTNELSKDARMPSVDIATCNLRQIETNEGTKTVFEVPSQIPDINTMSNATSQINFVMIDVSGSMQNDWHIIMEHWNSIIAELLFGHTLIYVFGSRVEFRRHGILLHQSDFLNSTTNLTGAIERLRISINECKERFVRVFLFTDGMHNATKELPSNEIKKLRIPPGKKIEVFLLGLREDFPVEYSMQIRSLLHNGSANVPSLFWAKDCWEIENQLRNMADIIHKGVTEIKMSEAGYICPEFKMNDMVQMSEYILFHSHPNELMKKLKLFTIDEKRSEIEIPCKFVIKPTTVPFLLDKVFRQWNSIIIQAHNKHQPIPKRIFEIMEDIYEKLNKKIEHDLKGDSVTIESRLAKKSLRHFDNDFAHLMNLSKTIVGLLKGNFRNEMELAESILKTTVKGKYDMKNIKMKGHCMDNYEEDMKAFMIVYNDHKGAIMALDDPDLDDCCNVTYQSPILDLKEDTFSEVLVLEDKFSFMKNFALTGIPIYSPVTDASQINPWALCIKNILVTPYNILSQCVLELAAASTKSGTNDEQNKGIYLVDEDKSTLVNAIIPVFNKKVASVLKPLVRTNLFGMLNTFCILKNVHVIDMNAHFAALGCAFVKMICDFPSDTRPSHITKRINLIEYTAQIYLDRKGFKKYAEVLCSNPREALMTESKLKFDDMIIKCETLVKAAFFLYLHKNDPVLQQKLEKTMQLYVIEFIGRNLSKYHEQTSYTDFFVPELSSDEKRKDWMEKQLQKAVHIFEEFIAANGNILRKYYKLEDLLTDVKMFTSAKIESSVTYEIIPCMDKINKLHHPSSAGNIYFQRIRNIASEVGLSAEAIERIYSPDQVFTYLYHGLQNKNSFDRLTKEVLTYEKALEIVRRKVRDENQNQLNKLSIKRVVEEAVKHWNEEYMKVHKDIIKPMTPDEIVLKACDLGVNVTRDNFNSVYRYNSASGLLRNACMCIECPHYLIPNRSFNQHVSIERSETTLGHLIHKTCMIVASRKNGNIEMVLKKLLKKKLVATCGRKTMPTRPSKSDLKKYKIEIEELLSLYRTYNPIDGDNAISDSDNDMSDCDLATSDEDDADDNASKNDESEDDCRNSDFDSDYSY